jgi:hypothetical protein
MKKQRNTGLYAIAQIRLIKLALLILCSASSYNVAFAASCAVGDVTFGEANSSSLQCFGAFEKNQNVDLNDFSSILKAAEEAGTLGAIDPNKGQKDWSYFEQDHWSFFGGYEETDGAGQGIEGGSGDEVKATVGETTGTWSIKPDLTGWIAVTLKAGSWMSGYLYYATESVSGGRFITQALDGKDLSNPRVFTFDDPNWVTMPLPASAWLFASALAGFGWIRRKSGSNPA